MSKLIYQKFQVQANATPATLLTAPLAMLNPIQELPQANALKNFYTKALKKHKKQAEESDVESQQESVITEETTVNSIDAISFSANDLRNDSQEDSYITLTSSAASKTDSDDRGWGYIVPFLLLGGVAGAALSDNKGSNGSPVETADTFNCDVDFDIPSKPDLNGGTLISAARAQSTLQDVGDLLTMDNGANLIVTTAWSSRLSESGNGAYSVYAAGDIGDVYVSAGENSFLNLELAVDGGIGNFTVMGDSDVRKNNIEVTASGDIDTFTYYDAGTESSAYISINVSGGDIGSVDVLSTSVSGGANISFSASATVVGSGLVGGNVGHINAYFEGTLASGSINVDTYGGNIGNIEFHTCGASASAGGRFSAYHQLDGDGNAVGGSVGNIYIMASGFSADPEFAVLASGGDIGNITLIALGDDTQADGNFTAKSLLDENGDYVAGGNVGNILIHKSAGSSGSAQVYINDAFSVGDVSIENIGDNNYSGYTNLNVNLSGVSGSVATIGDVSATISNTGGRDNSAYISISGIAGASIGNISAEAFGGYSAQFLINAYAESWAPGVGGTIGDISLADTSVGGNHNLNLTAGTSIGGVSVELGGGDSGVRMRIETLSGGASTVGDINVTVQGDQYGAAGYTNLVLREDTVAGDITVTGGSELSEYAVNSSGATAMDVDMANFLGFSNINVSNSVGGISIYVAQNGSLTKGTAGQDSIYLNVGDDTVDFTSFDNSSSSDVIYGFDVLDDDLKLLYAGQDFYELTSNQAISIDTNDVVTLVDLASGDNIMTDSGLLDALNGGEYGLIDSSIIGGSFTFATATSTSATSFNLYRVDHNGSVYSNSELMAVVNFDTGLTFADLTTSDFSTVI